MKFFVIIGKENLYVFERNGGRAERQYIEGNPFYPYDFNNTSEDVNAFLDDLTNEKNLGTKAKLEFEILENADPIRTEAVMRVLDEYKKEVYKLPDTILSVLKKLSKDKELKIAEYGINYDGSCYKMDSQNKLLSSPFDLLAYTIHEDDIMECI